MEHLPGHSDEQREHEEEEDMDGANDDVDGEGGEEAASDGQTEEQQPGDEAQEQQPVFVRPPVTAQVTEQQIQALKSGGSVRPGGSLADFYKDLEQYTPAIPDAVALFYMRKNGIANPDPRVVRLFSLATQKFIADICLDAMQQARIKGLGQVRKGTREVKYCLSMDLLLPVLEEYGIQLDRPPYYQ